MKSIYLILTLCISTIYSQNEKTWNKIEYTQIIDSQITKSQLDFNNNESVYYFGNKTIIDTTSLNITYVITDDIGSVIYKNKEKNKLFTRQANGKEVLLINDCFPVLDWKISDQTKKIGTIVLKKASTIFRGRNYIAWFDETIACDNGPLKMGGLPGLILELSTDDNYLNISFDKIYLRTNEPDNLERIKTKYDRSITQKEWVKESKDLLDIFVAKIKAKQSRDSSVNITVGEPLEKKYEWTE